MPGGTFSLTKTGTSGSPGQISTVLQGYYDRNLLERAVPALLYGRFGQSRPLPKNSGNRINFRRYNALTPATTPLTEGVTPTGSQLNVTDIYATISQYGDFVTITDWLITTGLDPVLVEAGEILGEQAGLTLDVITRDILVAGTQVRYSNGSARNAVNTPINTTALNAAIRMLESAEGKKIKSMIDGTTKIGTKPIRPAYIAITHTHARYDLESLSGWVPVEEYASKGDIFDEEIGSYRGVRFITTSVAKVWADSGGAKGTMISTSGTNADVYATLILAENAYGVIPLDRKSITNIIKQLGSAGSEDPLDQRATSGWKAAYTAKILNDNWMVRIEHACTAL